MDLQTSIQDLGGWFKRYSYPLKKLGIETLEDLLFHIPSRYEDFSLISKINLVQEGEVVTIQGTILEIKNAYARKGMILQKAKAQDETGIIEVTWYNQPFLTRAIKINDKVSLSGKIGIFLNKLTLESPQYEVISQNNETIHTGRLVPIYPETKGISSKWLRRQIYKILSVQKQNLLEYIPSSIKGRYDLMEFQKAIEMIHFPSNLTEAHRAKERLAFDELLKTHLASLSRKKNWEKKLVSQPFSIAPYKIQIEDFWEKLPFELTNAQKRAVKDIFGDLASKKPMNRLLEGDVGSGKTVVATIAMYLAHLNGFQSVLMTPTEILANQHYNTISNLSSPLGVKVGLATGSKKLDINEFDILVGTHAVLSEKVNYNNLGLVVIDEQQRFGVEQRTLIRKKGKNPHLLTMTATPIPRTVALTIYGDLDLSLLDEMPKGRRIIKTWLVPTQKRENAYKWIEQHLKKTQSQAFIICPFIEESESMITVKAAKKEYERLQKDVFPNLKLGLLHGKQKVKERDGVLNKFREGKLDILVATPVVEVGIDIANTTIMLIEAAERFGLAGLHQLRGRVGRGEKQSYCLLFTESSSAQTTARLRAMETMHVGAELAELDLRLRGPGEIYGTMQHGQTKLKFANFSDLPLIEKTRKEAEELLPKLSQYPLLLKKVKEINIKQVSPD